jgi:hypothetical protein
VSTCACPVDHDLIAFSDGVVNGEPEIGEAVAAALDVPPDILSSGGQ